MPPKATPPCTEAPGTAPFAKMRNFKVLNANLYSIAIVLAVAT
jgi:hypothetical protein